MNEEGNSGGELSQRVPGLVSGEHAKWEVFRTISYSMSSLVVVEFFHFYLVIVDLQGCVSFRCTAK